MNAQQINNQIALLENLLALTYKAHSFAEMQPGTILYKGIERKEARLQELYILRASSK